MATDTQSRREKIDRAILKLEKAIVRSFDGPVLVYELNADKARRILRELLRRKP